VKERIERIINSANEESVNISDLKSLEEFRIKYLGKKAELSSLLKDLGSLTPEEKPSAGKLLNEAKNLIQNKIDALRKRFENSEKDDFIKRELIDLTLPGTKFSSGHFHLLTTTMDNICEIFVRLGFEVKTGPELETDFYNFEALNIPSDHPAREDFDSFYTESGNLLRTHTSPVQIRSMLSEPPPIAMVCPGKCYRRDAIDATHYPMFHQVEGLMVDENISLGDLKGILESFCRHMFGSHINIRFRPSFFPFTEPSAEIDISCVFCGGKGCNVCKNTGWVEILGAGMVDPEVFKAVNYDSERWTGFAFGMGVERVAMLKFDINDIRLFFDNELDFLEQF